MLGYKLKFTVSMIIDSKKAPIFKKVHNYGYMLNGKVGKEHTVFDLIGARGAYVNLFSTTSAKRSSSGR